MARLLLINGAPCSGKSTLARRCAADHPLALALDVDVVRSLLGRWDDDPHAAGTAARALALAMARTHLVAGHDVVVPQLLVRAAFIDQLEALAAEVGVPFVEVVVEVALPEVLARFRERSARADRPEHRDAAELVRRAGGEADLVATHERLAALVAARPRAHRIGGGGATVEATYAQLLEALG